ncbi:MAG TPA: hypothetical protein VGO40_05715 [Longimicrobium sp.]|jgi:hypothetical protein|nr:hypothetical protein [Longimicrobium sp.]
MSGNKVAYDVAYQRALDGKSSQSWWAFFTTYFEDEYTRQSRRRGERDGAAARDKHAAPEAAAPVN